MAEIFTFYIFRQVINEICSIPNLNLFVQIQSKITRKIITRID